MSLELTDLNMSILEERGRDYEARINELEANEKKLLAWLNAQHDENTGNCDNWQEGIAYGHAETMEFIKNDYKQPK
jgi:hypothetical protein